MYIRALVLVPALAAASVSLFLPPLLPRLADRLLSSFMSELNTSNGADGNGVHLSPQSFFDWASCQPSPQ
ncbi:hypothetical protein ACH4TV_47135 [Streptomyces sp. NPDC020898]|uniref:hypothetical protein n=1 Tax=Streptomyces sp. NPDC020898 TaxID=3365101 RepID=UPI00378E7CB7